MESTESAPAPGLRVSKLVPPWAACQSKHMSSWEAPAPPASAAALEPFAPEVIPTTHIPRQGDAAIVEQAGEHGERGDRQRLIDKRFLGVNRCRRAAAWQGVFFLIQHLRKQLGHDAQPVFTPAVARVQGLTEDEFTPENDWNEILTVALM